MKKELIGVCVLGVALAVGIWWQWPGKDAGLNSATTESAARSAAVVANDRSPGQEGRQGGWRGGEDFLMEFHRLKGAAEQGDTVAQLGLSEIYERCAGYAASPEKYVEGIESLATANESQRAAVENLAKRVSERCRAVSNAGSFSGLDYQEWLMRAAQSGSLTANARLMTRSFETPNPDNVKKVADLAIAGKDAKALFETGELMARVEDSGALGAYQAVSGPGVGAYAWGVVACRMGLNCGPSSLIMDSLCLNTGKCSYSSYEDFIRGEFIPRGEQVKLDQAIEFIVNNVNGSSK